MGNSLKPGREFGRSLPILPNARGSGGLWEWRSPTAGSIHRSSASKPPGGCISNIGDYTTIARGWQLKCFLFLPRSLGKWSNLTNIFPRPTFENLKEDLYYYNPYGSIIPTWQFFVTFLGWLSDPFKWLSDLQLGDEKVTLNHLVSVFFFFGVCHVIKSVRLAWFCQGWWWTISPQKSPFAHLHWPSADSTNRWRCPHQPSLWSPAGVLWCTISFGRGRSSTYGRGPWLVPANKKVRWGGLYNNNDLYIYIWQSFQNR